MAWCEANRAEYLSDFARSERLEAAIQIELAATSLASTKTGEPGRRDTGLAHPFRSALARRERNLWRRNHA